MVGLKGFFTPDTITGYSVLDTSQNVPVAVQDGLKTNPQISDPLDGIYVGCIKKCSFSDLSCGQCYCLNFERGCPPLDSDQRLSSYVGKQVKIRGSEGIFGKEQCSMFLKAQSIEILGNC